MYRVILTFIKEGKQSLSKCFSCENNIEAQRMFFTLMGTKDAVVQMFYGSKEIYVWPDRKRKTI